MDHRDALAVRARHRRMTLKLSIEEVAARGGTSHVTISNIEAGRSVKLHSLWKLDDGLGWPPGTAERLLTYGTLYDPVTDTDFTDPVEQAIWGEEALPEHARRAFIGELRAQRAEVRREHLKGLAADENNGATASGQSAC